MLPFSPSGPDRAMGSLRPFFWSGLFLSLSAVSPSAADEKIGRGIPEKTEAGSPPAPEPASPVVEAISGVLKGPLRYARGEGSAKGSLQVGETIIPLEEALSIRFAEKKASAGEALLYLGGEDELFATIQGGDETALRVRAYAVRGRAEEGSLTIPLETLRGVAFPRRFKDESRGIAQVRRWISGPAARPGSRDDPAREGPAREGPDREAPAREASGKEGSAAGDFGGTEDRVLLIEGAELAGVLKKIDREAVHFESRSAGEVRLPLEKVRAVSIAALSAEKPAPPEAEGGLTAVVQFQDGSSLSGNLLLLGEEGLRLLTRSVGEVASPLDRVRGLSFRGGRCQYLSDLDPAKVTHRGDLFVPWDIRRDLSATGDPIRIRGKEYRKGLGMHSHCRVDYDLGGQFSRFQSVIGMDDRARPETTEARQVSGGVAVFRVHLDGRVALEKELSWSDPPFTVDIPVEGVKTLGLELDYGPGFLVLDRGNWADARIIRKN